jgi:DNA-binding MarR family transcriptional regulator
LADGISPEIKRFISEYIDSVELLEILLLVRSGPKNEWSVDSISRELRSTPESVANRLKDLSARGLLLRKEGPVSVYHYHPGKKELDAAIEGLARVYAERRAGVIDLIFSKPIDTLRHFSDAFKLRKEP